MRSFRSHGAAFFLSAALMLAILTPYLGQPAHAQATNAAGAIQGTITDPSGAVVAGAKVAISEPETGFNKVVITSSAGIYSLGSLEGMHSSLRF